MKEMNKYRYILISMAAVLSVLSSCKKDEEESSKLYLSGTLAVACEGYGNLPNYVSPGDKFTFTPSGLYVKDDESIIVDYYFVNPFTSAKDTVKAGEGYTLTVADTLATFSLSCVGFARNSKDYYTSSKFLQFAVVKSGLNTGSITGFPMIAGETSAFLNGKPYFTTKVGSSEWLRQNLAYVQTDSKGSVSFGHYYLGSAAMLDIMGAYYTWEEAQTACPAGWRLPSEADWVALCTAAGGKSAAEMQQIEGAASGLMAYTKFNGVSMWEYYRGVEVNDKTRFSCMPTGYATVSDGVYQFFGYSEYAAYWTSAEKDGEGVYRYIYKDKDIVYVGTASKTGFAASVRCVR